MTGLMNVPRAGGLLEIEGIDGLLAASFENVYYLTGFWSENFFMFPNQTQIYAIVSKQQLELAHLVCGLGEAANVYSSCGERVEPHLYGNFARAVRPDGTLDELEEFVREQVIERKPYLSVVDASSVAIEEAGLGKAKIAYDERAVFPHCIAELARRLKTAEFVPGWELFRRIRAVKTQEEQRRLTAALRLNERAIVAAMRLARVGVSEKEMVDEYERVVDEGGGRTTFAHIYFGRRGAVGYLRDHGARLEAEDIVRFDVGCRLEGYHSDIARNFCLQEPSPRARSIYRALLEGEEAAAAALRPGETASKVFEAGVRAVREAGLVDFSRHHVGHAIGLELYDLPILAPTDETLIESGMVFEVETPYYELGFAGLQPEDTVLVTDRGAEFLTSISRAFQVGAP